jgi:hypothetical protein
MLQKMLIQESCDQSQSILASAFIGNKILERHINHLHWIWKEVAYTPNGVAYLNFEWNSKIKTYSSELNIDFSNEGALIWLLEEYFQKWYILVNIQQVNESWNIRLKQIKES